MAHYYFGAALVVLALSSCSQFAYGIPCGGSLQGNEGRFFYTDDPTSSSAACVWILRLLSTERFGVTLNSITNGTSVGIFTSEQAGSTFPVIPPLFVFNASNVDLEVYPQGEVLLVVLNSGQDRSFSLSWEGQSHSSRVPSESVNYLDWDEGEVYESDRDASVVAFALNPTSRNLDISASIIGYEDECADLAYSIFEVNAAGNLREVARICGRPITLQNLRTPLIAFVAKASPYQNETIYLSWRPNGATTTSTTTTTTTTTTGTPELCSDNKNPEECYDSSLDCAFCFDLCGYSGPRCDSVSNLIAAGCQVYDVLYEPDVSPPGTDVPTPCDPFVLFPGQKVNISVTFEVDAVTQPLDLYYLMDLSTSMSDDLTNLVRLSQRLLETLNNISIDFEIGFGAFVDKPRAPLGNPAVDYSFINVLPLTSNGSAFLAAVAAARVRDGADIPESQADALAQSAACVAQVGWRSNSRRAILLATDATPHLAGDGAAAGITTPFEPGCYLDSQGNYTEQLTYDYPSIAQLSNLTSDNRITTIFAVTSDFLSYYQTNVSPHLPPSFVGVLSLDSSNIIELVRDAFEDLNSRFELETGSTGGGLRFRSFSNCTSNPDDEETSICEDVTPGDLTFTVEVELVSCPAAGVNETSAVTSIGQLGFPTGTKVGFAYFCDTDW